LSLVNSECSVLFLHLAQNFEIVILSLVLITFLELT